MKKFLFITGLFLFVGQICTAQFAGGSSASRSPQYTQRDTQNSYASGYKGFGEIGFTAGGDYYGAMASASFYTSHGYQFAPYVFVGAGIGLEAGTHIYMPLFAECRVNLLNPDTRSVTPYLGSRVGYAALEDAGSAYFNFFAGIRVPLRRNALHINIGYQLTGIYTEKEYSYYNYNYGYGYWHWDYYYDHEYCHSFSLRIGYEF